MQGCMHFRILPGCNLYDPIFSAFLAKFSTLSTDFSTAPHFQKGSKKYAFPVYISFIDSFSVFPHFFALWKNANAGNTAQKIGA